MCFHTLNEQIVVMLHVCFDENKLCKALWEISDNSWPILQTSVTFPVHASIEMYGGKFILEYHKSAKVAI